MTTCWPTNRVCVACDGLLPRQWGGGVKIRVQVARTYKFARSRMEGLNAESS